MDNTLIQRKRLIEYLPSFMAQFREMQEIMSSEDVEFDSVNRNIPDVLNNAFIEDCNEYGIQKYESVLKITPGENDSLETRKTRVLLRWNDSVPYNYKALIMKLNILCGVNNYDINAELENYFMEFVIYSANMEELEILLNKMLPQNIAYDIYMANKYAGTGKVCMVWQDDEVFELRQVIL